MARKRMIDPGIWPDEGFLELSHTGRLLFIGLISWADDEGRGVASAKSLKSKLFPGDDISISEIDANLEAVALYTHTTVYEVEGVRYYQLAKWRSYQKVDHPSKSTLPAIPRTLPERSPNDTRTFGNGSRQLTNELINESINKEMPFGESSVKGFGESGKAEIAEALESIREGLEEEPEF